MGKKEKKKKRKRKFACAWKKFEKKETNRNCENGKKMKNEKKSEFSGQLW